MGTYRFFEFNISGLIDRAHDVRLASEAQAHAHAAALASCWPVEIWRGNRRVASIPPMRVASPAPTGVMP